MSRLMTRRDVLRGALGAPIAITMPGWMTWLGKLFAPKPEPNLRQIGFAIQESIGFLVFKPVAIQQINQAALAASLAGPLRRRVDYTGLAERAFPIYTLSGTPAPKFKAQRFESFEKTQTTDGNWCLTGKLARRG